MGSLGMQEIIVIFVLALIIFGPRKLPDLGKSLGRGMAEFKKASNELKQTWEDEVRLEKERQDMAEILKDSSDWKRSMEEEVRLESESSSSTTVNSKEEEVRLESESPSSTTVNSKEIQ
jgi:sec-independent protein translocase protein TatA